MATDISLSYENGSTISNSDAIRQQYEIALLTSPGELSADPDFGIGIKRFVSEVNNEQNAKALKQLIVSKTRELFSEISINKIEVIKTAVNTITINIDFTIVPFAKRTTISHTIGV